MPTQDLDFITQYTLTPPTGNFPQWPDRINGLRIGPAVTVYTEEIVHEEIVYGAHGQLAQGTHRSVRREETIYDYHEPLSEDQRGTIQPEYLPKPEFDPKPYVIPETIAVGGLMVVKTADLDTSTSEFAPAARKAAPATEEHDPAISEIASAASS